MTVTFEQVTKIEAIRRKIETKQQLLDHLAHAEFTISDNKGKGNVALPFDLQEPAREATCKATVMAILNLLEEAHGLGVDITASKQALVEFMERFQKRQGGINDLSMA